MTSAVQSGTRSSHRWAESPGNFDRLNLRAVYPGDNEWGIPQLTRANWTPARLVSYASRSEVAAAGDDAAIHFFLDDYRFETVWSKPERGLSRIARIGGALTPDFSLWRDMPLAMQLWQVYRSRWCGCWLAEHGIRVIPTISWSTDESFSFAFSGVPTGGVVAVSTVGIRRSDEPLFEAGYAEMVRRLSPSLVLVYGRAPTEQVSGLCTFRVYETRWKVMGGRGSGSGRGSGGNVPKASRGEILEVIKLPPSVSPSAKHKLLTTKFGLTAAEATAALKEAGLL